LANVVSLYWTSILIVIVTVVCRHFYLLSVR